MTHTPSGWRAQLPRAVDPSRRSTYHRTKHEAEDWLADQLDRFARGLALDDGLTPLGEYADAWLERHDRGDDDPTLRTYRVRRAHLDPIAHVPLEDLRVSHVEIVLAAMRKRTGRDGRPLSVRYQRLVIGLLSSILTSAIRDGILSTNAAALAPLPKLPQSQTLVLSETEARALLNASRGNRWHAVWWIMLAVGLRSGEVRALRRDDYDAASGRLRVMRSVRTPHTVRDTKGRRERWVPLPAGCVSAIEQHLELLRTGDGIPPNARRRNAPSVANSVWLFPSHVTGRPFPGHTLWHRLRQDITAAGITRIRPHDLRHSAVTFMLADGRPLPVVAEIVGHRSSSFTAGRYGHVLGGQYRDVAEAMDRVLSDPPASTKDQADSDASAR